MTASVRILTTSSVDSSPAILLVAPDGSKILVNCGEGCQRSFLEHSQRLSTVKAICLTHLGHEAVGGLPGAILTTADAAAATEAHTVIAQAQQQQQQQQAKGGTDSMKKQFTDNEPKLPDLEIVGPQGTQQFLRSLRHFMRRDRFKVHAHEGAVDNLCPVKQPNKRKGKKKGGDTSVDLAFRIKSLAFPETVETSCNDPEKMGSRKRPHPEELFLKRQTLSFVMKTPPIPGKFMPETAAALGVPKGPLYAQLKSGKAVVFVDNNGTECRVESSEVVAPSSPAVAIFVLYYPSREVAQAMFSSKALKDEAESPNMFLEVVIHIAPQSLLEEHGLPFFKECHQNESIEHIFLSTDPSAGDLDGTPFRSAAFGATTRSLLCKSIYDTVRPADGGTQQPTPEDYKVGRTMMEYALIPRLKRGYIDNHLELDERNKVDATSLVKESGALAISQDILMDFRDQISTVDRAGGELIFTGTGSAVPCKHRNVTGMLLKQADGRSILLDVGEGTIGQLLRRQQLTPSDNVLASIQAVWISHPHADHHLGLIRLLKDRQSPEPIQLLAPTPLFRFLDEYTAIDPSLRDSYYAIDCKYLVNENHELQMRLQRTLGIQNCRAVPVTHCAHAYAVILDGTSFGRVVYSGDCRPSQQLAKAAKGSDLLIHEATFEDGMEAEAALKKHSTVGEALRVAQEMEAKCTILTHFSQRYPKIPPTPTGDAYKFPIIFAFDYMTLRSHTLLIASKLTPALRLLFPEEDEDKSIEDTCMESSVAAEALSVPGAFSTPALL